MTKKKPTEKTRDEKKPDKPNEREKEKPASDELPSLSHLDLEDALKKVMEVPWNSERDD